MYAFSSYNHISNLTHINTYHSKPIFVKIVKNEYTYVKKIDKIKCKKINVDLNNI